ncbi:MAG: gliding motility-associated C-terminal domain-containing protein [Flavobacterium sp.]
MRRPFEHGATAEPFEIGYYRSQDNLNAFNGIDPNGDWTIQINESSFATGVQFNKVELVFRNPFTVLDYTSINSYDNCQTPYCLGISEIIVASNNGFTNQVGDMYNPNTSSCSWNAAQNNSAWFKFRAASSNVKITISGITNNLQILGIDAGPDGNPCTANDNLVLVGGCPNLASNDTYSSPQYLNGSNKNNQLNLSGLIPGVVYYFLVDGTGAAVSPFYIEIEGASVNCSNCNLNPLASSNSPLCEGENLVLSVDQGVSWIWTGPNNFSSTSSNPIVTNIGAASSGIYTVVVTDSNGCLETASTVVAVNTPITPLFNSLAPICSGATVAALPTTSNNGISGTWAPALNNTATTTYTFTPNAGQCATTTTLTITVNPQVTPTFTAVAPICAGATLTALPTTSNNGISGTWAPALNNTATTTYTFTPTAGQCATTTTLTITVNPQVTPTFTAVAPICAGATVVALPTTSNNGISGTWAPALNNTATTTYTFTPNIGQCATTTTLTITVNPQVTPIFTAVSPICSGATLVALPTTSNNGISGTWAPALNNTATTTYTFTPNPGQCATTTTITITVNPQVTPTFAIANQTYCQGATVIQPILPIISTNGIAGSWNPPSISTTQVGVTTHIFTPNEGQCALTTSLTITVNALVVPTFDAIAPICAGDILMELSTISDNGISGTWSPALNNTATTTYTFTPSIGQCASVITQTIVVVPDPQLIIQGDCEGEEYVLRVLPAPQNGSVSWFYDSVGSNPIFLGNTTFIVADQIGTYTAVYNNSSCEKQYTFFVENNYCKIPKGVSANNDGLNDTFDLSNLKVKYLKIFNRYGTVVYEKANYIDEWDGKSMQGNRLPDGTYYYYIEFMNNKAKTGWVYLTQEY